MLFLFVGQSTGSLFRLFPSLRGTWYLLSINRNRNEAGPLGRFYISLPRYARFRIVSQYSQAQSRAPVVKITSKGPFGWTRWLFVEFGSWVVAGSEKQNKKERQKRNYFVTRSHLSEFELRLAVVTRSEQLELIPPRVPLSYIRNSFSLEVLYFNNIHM